MDDTTGVGYPHFTNRDRKSVAGRRRFEMTPWLCMDEARQEQMYVYSQGGYSKGGNRWCTQMYLVIKALKESGTPAADARTCVIIGDNYSENKNNVDFAFCNELIMRGWYDNVYLYYGPVGHTHNGVDSVHHVHNQSACNYVLGTPADLANMFQQTWQEMTRPSFHILEKQLHWKKYYQHHFAKIKGFTKTKKDPLTVHGFRFKRAKESGTIEMHWKEVPSDSAPWRGIGNVREGTGYRILRSRPQGVPESVAPKKMTAKKRKAVLGDGVRKALKDEGMEDAYGWLKGVVDNGGFMKVNHVVQRQRMGELGDLVEIGVGLHTARVRLIQDVPTTSEAFWSLPASAVRQPDNNIRPLPMVLYKDDKDQRDAERAMEVPVVGVPALAVPALAMAEPAVAVDQVVVSQPRVKKRGRPILTAAEKERRLLERKADASPSRKKKRGRPCLSPNTKEVRKLERIVAKQRLADANDGPKNVEVQQLAGEDVPVSEAVVVADADDGPKNVEVEIEGLPGGEGCLDPSTVKVGSYVVTHSTYVNKAGRDVPGVSLGIIISAPDRVDGYLRWRIRSLVPARLCTSKSCVGSRWSLGPAPVEEDCFLYSVVATFPKLANGWFPKWVKELVREQSFYDQMIK
jgi:hypothetical protein